MDPYYWNSPDARAPGSGQRTSEGNSNAKSLTFSRAKRSPEKRPFSSESESASENPVGLLLASLQGCCQLEGETVSEHLKTFVAKGNLTQEQVQQLIQFLCLWKAGPLVFAVDANKPGGVRNNGNSCFMAAALQMFGQICYLTGIQISNGRGGMYNQLVSKFVTTINAGGLVPSAEVLRGIKDGAYSDNTVQYDATEFFIQLHDALGSPFESLLTASTSKVLKCNCREVKPQLDNVFPFILPFEKIGSLYEYGLFSKGCGKSENKEDCLDGNNGNCCLTDTTTITALPQFVCVQIQRLKFDRSKRSDRQFTVDRRQVVYPMELEVPVDNVNKQYGLVGLIAHVSCGKENGGHYVSMRKVEGAWYLCNDAEVTPCGVDYVLSHCRRAVFLLYRSIEVQALADKVSCKTSDPVRVTKEHETRPAYTKEQESLLMSTYWTEAKSWRENADVRKSFKERFEAYMSRHHSIPYKATRQWWQDQDLKEVEREKKQVRSQERNKEYKKREKDRLARRQITNINYGTVGVQAGSVSNPNINVTPSKATPSKATPAKRKTPGSGKEGDPIDVDSD